MERVIILSKLSLSMMPEDCLTDVRFEIVTKSDVIWDMKHREVISGVRSPNMAKVYSEMLGREIPVNRLNFKIEEGDTVFIGRYTGPRLSEGATCLPEGAMLQWWCVEVLKPRENYY